MSVRQQRGNRSVFNLSTQLGRREGFWPFDPWDDPEGDLDGKPNPIVGDDSGHSSIKNYPSSTRAPIRKEERIERQPPAQKRLRRKKTI